VTVEPPRGTIAADIPYIRSGLASVHVEYTSRILGDDTIERRSMTVRNGRTAAVPPTLDHEGLELVSWPSRVARGRLDELVAEKPLLTMRPIEFDYWAEIVPLLQARTGARDVVPIHASVVRYSTSADRSEMMTPAGWAHLDYDSDEAAVQLRETLERSGRQVQPFSRYVLYQTWRALTDPPQDYPLAICDCRTVDAGDIVPLHYHVAAEQADGEEVTYQSQGCRHSDRHEWWYFPDLTIDDVVVFVGFDSARGDRPSSLHVSFEDLTVPEPVPRASIESRFFALFT
jgi:hypothetical protein